MLAGHGDDGYKHHRGIAADFSTNVWYGGAPAGLKEHVFGLWDKVQKYPEVLGESLTHKIAVHHGYSDDYILIANGSTESIYLIAQAFKGKRTTILIPSFAEYEDACRLHDHDMSFLNWEQLSPDTKLDTDILFICNPNNPTGYVFKDIEKLFKVNPHVIFVVDEAFIEFTLAITSVIGLVADYDHIIVMRSMTKAYAIPGLRLGYIAASPVLISRLTRLKLPWTVNVMALEAGHYIFDHYDELQLPIRQLLNDKDELIAGLAGSALKINQDPQIIDFDNPFTTHQNQILCSKTHFFVAKTMKQDSAALKQFLLKEFDILIRDAGNFRNLSNKSIRIATLSKHKNQLLINALSVWESV